MKKVFCPTLILALLMSFCFAGSALADSIKEYSTDMVNVKSGLVMQKLAVTPDKIYSESLNAKGQRDSIAIIRMDQRKMYIFIEETKSYMELPFNKEKFTAADLNIGLVQTKREKVGTETVNGYTADKFKITATVMGMTTTNFSWIAPEFDPMPIRTETTNGDVQEMRNIKIGSPDAALFDIPTGYKRDTQMEEMMKNMMKGMMGEK